MERKIPTRCTVISYGDSSNGTEKKHLRIVDGQEELTLAVRPAEVRHRNFILSTWVKSVMPTLRRLEKEFKNFGTSTEELLMEEVPIAEALWEKSLVVTPEDDSFAVHAWICGEPGKLHYAYVPPELRQKGIFTALTSHLCGPMYEYGRPWPFKRGPSNGRYNPYVLGKGTGGS